MALPCGNDVVAADAVGALAAVAHRGIVAVKAYAAAGDGAGRFTVQARRVGRSRLFLKPCDCRVDIGNDLIYANHHNDLLRAEHDAGNAV